MKYSFKKNNRGATLILMTLLVLTGVLAVSLSVSEVVRIGLTMSKTQINSTMAYYAAEAGMERILWEIRKQEFNIPIECVSGECINFDILGDIDNPSCDAACANAAKYFTLASNDSTYRIFYDEVGADSIVTSAGNSREVNRVLKVQFETPTLCISTCAAYPGCRMAAIANSTDNGDICCVAGMNCYECDAGYYWDSALGICAEIVN